MKAEKYKVRNYVTGKAVGIRKTLKGARTLRDREDEKAGRLQHAIRPVNPA